jgi:DNA polymerase bacteriophage-type
MSILSIDFESRSRVDLRKTGVYPYAADPSTDLWCMAFAFDDEDVELWVPRSAPAPPRIVDHVVAGGELRAWNAQFERVVWNRLLAPRYGFPVPALEQWHDTAAEAAAMALPRGLEDAANALGLPVQKDAIGRRLMLQMAKPRKPTKSDPREWWDDSDKLSRLYTYCMQDVRVERAVAKKLRRLSKFERAVYLLDQRINDRGVGLDTELIDAAQKLVLTAAKRADEEIRELTGGEVLSVRKVADLTSWLQARGVELDDVRKNTLRDLLARDDVADIEREVITLRAEGAKSSTAKLTAMQKAADTDGRARGLLLYHGAATGRWAGKLIQPQNFPRPMVKRVEQFIPDVLAGDFDYISMQHPVLGVLSSMLRSMLVATPGHRYVAADFSQIEARVVAWIAGQDDLVELFASGGKIYETMAAYIYGMTVDEVGKDSVERQIGKNTVLGCGFGMGWKTFKAQVQLQTGIELSDKDAQRAVKTYRRMYSLIRRFWYDIEAAAMTAVHGPGRLVTCGRNDSIQYLSSGDALWCILPSKRTLCYMRPQISTRTFEYEDEDGVAQKITKDSLSFKGVNAVTRRWERQWSFGGHLTENVVQAMARDIMATAMLRVEQAGYPVVLTVHDEVVTDTPVGHGSLDEFVQLVQTLPRWADGLPVAAEGWEGERYRK